MENKLRIEAMDADNIPQSRLEDCASLYCTIWKEPPWNEDFWTLEGVIESIRKELVKEQALGLLAIVENKVVGFTWGYTVSADDMQHISGTKDMDIFFQNGNQVFYIDELGVDPKCRNQGIGIQLSTGLLDWSIQTGHSDVLLRTDMKAHPARILYTRLGFEELNIIDAQECQRNYWRLCLNK